MSKVTVTKQFKEDFDVWAADRLKWGDFTEEDMAEFKVMLRKDMAPGPDQLREGLTVISQAGVEVPAMIDSHEDRIKAWTDYFSVCADEIRARYNMSHAPAPSPAGIPLSETIVGGFVRKGKR